MDGEKLLEDVTSRVREALTQAETRAKEIVAEAEAEARRIRERAETEAEQRLGQVRQALAGLEGVVGTAKPEAEVEPGPVPVPEPTPPAIPEPTPPVEPEPTPPAEPEPLPPEPEIEPPAPPAPDREPPAMVNGSGSRSDDKTAARIVATKMALDGKSREEIGSHLSAAYDLADPDKLLDDVLARAKR